jgi:AraC family transcriptional regulator
VHRPYEGEHVHQAAERLLTWAGARGLADGQWLGYQWDDPEIVALEKCRYDIGVEVPGTTLADGDVSVTAFPSCLMAEIEIAGSVELELRALEWLYRGWLPASGYAPAHQPMFEAFNGHPFAHGKEHFELRVQLAVVDDSIPL